MPISKCTMIFEQNQYGWTESYFLNTASSNLNDEMNALMTLASKRILLSGKQTKLTYLKVSQEGKARDVRIYSYVASTGLSLDGTSTEDSDLRVAAALIKRQNDDRTATSNLLLRGVWDRIIEGGELKANDPAWLAAFNAFKGTYISLNFGFPAKVVATSLKKPIANVTSDLNAHLVITTVGNVFAAPEVGTKRKIFVSGVQGAATVNGTQVVTVQSLSSCVTIARLPILPYLGNGFVTNNSLDFVRVTELQPLRAVERKTGRPLYLSRGRSRPRKLV